MVVLGTRGTTDAARTVFAVTVGYKEWLSLHAVQHILTVSNSIKTAAFLQRCTSTSQGTLITTRWQQTVSNLTSFVHGMNERMKLWNHQNTHKNSRNLPTQVFEPLLQNSSGKFHRRNLANNIVGDKIGHGHHDDHTLRPANCYVPHFLGAFAKLRKAAISVVMSVRPPAWNNSAPTGMTFIKCCIWAF